jgi:hypothetical protein
MHCISRASCLKFCVCRKFFAYSILVSQLYACISLTCYLTDLSGLDTCVCYVTYERTNLVVFLSLFSKIFLWLFIVFFELWNCIWILYYISLVLLRLWGEYLWFFSYFVYPLSFWDKNREYFFFFVLDQDCIFNRKVIFVSEWPKREFVSLWLAAFWLTKSLLCNIAIWSVILFISESSF